MDSSRISFKRLLSGDFTSDSAGSNPKRFNWKCAVLALVLIIVLIIASVALKRVNESNANFATSNDNYLNKLKLLNTSKIKNEEYLLGKLRSLNNSKIQSQKKFTENITLLMKGINQNERIMEGYSDVLEEVKLSVNNTNTEVKWAKQKYLDALKALHSKLGSEHITPFLENL